MDMVWRDMKIDTFKCDTNVINIFCFAAFNLHVIHSLLALAVWIVNCAVQHGGENGSPQKVNREGVYLDPNYVRQSPRKKRPGYFPPSPYKGVGPTPPKHGRQAKYHPGRNCGDCTIWLQMGAPEDLRNKHSIHKRAKQPDQQYVIPLIEWLRKGGLNVDLRFDSCMCLGCYQDCRDRRNDKPRYYYQLHSNKNEKQHCIVCHFNDSQNMCECPSARWAPFDWMCLIRVGIFEDYFSHENSKLKLSCSTHKDLCFTHFRQYERYVDNLTCAICSVKTTDLMKIGSMVTAIKPHFGKDNCNVSEDDWMCSDCSQQFLTKRKAHKPTLEEDLESNDCHVRLQARAVEYGLRMIEDKGYMFLSDLTNYYEEIMEATSDDVMTARRKFRDYAQRRMKEKEMETLCNKTTLGTMYYEKQQISRKAANGIYNIKESLHKNELSFERYKAASFKVSDIYQLLKEHAKSLPIPSSMDYRDFIAEMSNATFFFENVLNLSTNSGKKIVSFVCDITGVKSNDNIHFDGIDEENEEDRKVDPRVKMHTMNLRVQMLIALMLLLVSPRKIGMQVILGMVAFTKGLNEKGFQMLNRMGIVCSMNTIRKYGHRWSRLRNASDEIIDACNVKVSIDNLNYTMKMAKRIQDGFGGIKRQLNLITGQLCYTRKGDQHEPAPNTRQIDDTLSTASFVSKTPGNNEEWSTLISSLYQLTSNHIQNACGNIKDTLVKGLQAYMPSYTPCEGEKVVYTTVQEVEPKFGPLRKYLCQLKVDLKIGMPGHLQHVLLCGDQQIYDLITKIKTHDNTR